MVGKIEPIRGTALDTLHMIQLHLPLGLRKYRQVMEASQVPTICYFRYRYWQVLFPSQTNLVAYQEEFIRKVSQKTII